MIFQNFNKSTLINKFSLLLLITVFIIIFFLETLYFLPSPSGDGVWFLKLSFNICRDNLFVSTNPSIFSINSESLPWITHGWFNQYIMAKLNYNCSLKGIFIFNFFVKIFSSILIYLIFKEKKIPFIYVYLLIFLTLIIQLKLQFRPETFSIFLYLILIYNFFKKNFLIVGILLSLIFFTQPTIFCLISLFGVIIYFNEFIKNYTKIFLGFLICFGLLNYIYPYTFLEFIQGLWSHRNGVTGTYSLLNGGFNQIYIQNIKTYYIKTNFLPFSGFLILFVYLFLISRKKLLIFTLPFIFFFGPNTPVINYVLISLIPLFLILLICSDNKLPNEKMLKYLFSLILIISSLGLAQYLLRNVFTAIQYPDELNKTKKFLLKNQSNIKIYPNFSFIIDKNFKSISLGKKNSSIDDFNLKIYSINGRRNPCIKKNPYKNEPQPIRLFSKKIFNSNSGYGIWICNE